MAVSAFQQLSWRDKHTIYLSHLYSLYSEEIMWDRQLCDLGYTGIPDPRYTNGVEYTPDLLAFSSKGDVQHFKIIDCKDIDADSSPERYLEREFEEVSQYQNISEEMIKEYVSLHNKTISADIQEEVVLLPEDRYKKHKDIIQRLVSEHDVILWLIEINGSAAIWKELGDHSNMDLDSQVRDQYNSYPDGTDLLQFTRKGDSDTLKYAFIHKLVKYCSRNNQRKFTFEEIDEVMVDVRPQILYHLPATERKNRWRDCMHTLLNYIEEVEQVEESTYQWKKKQFIKEPRYRNRLLNEVSEQLGLE